MSDPRLFSWDNPLGRLPGIPIEHTTWLTSLAAPGCTIPSTSTLAKCGTSAVAPVVWTTTVRSAARAVTGALPARELVGTLTSWAVAQLAGRLDLAPVTVALLAARCDLTDEQVAGVMASCRPGLPPLSDDMLVALTHTLGASRRADLTDLLTAAGSDSAAWRRFHETGRRLALAEPTRIAATSCPQHWAALVARRVSPAGTRDPRWAQLLESAATPAGRRLTALRTREALARVETDWGVSLAATTAGSSDRTVQPFTAHDPDASRVAAGTLELGWDAMRVVGLCGPGGRRPPGEVADDVVGHVAALHAGTALGHAAGPFT